MAKLISRICVCTAFLSLAANVHAQETTPTSEAATETETENEDEAAEATPASTANASPGRAPVAVTVAAPAAALTETVAARPAEETDDEVWTISLGSTLVTGNARTFQLTVGTHAQIRRDEHQLTADGNLAFGIASVRQCTDAMGALGPCGGAFTTPNAPAGTPVYYDWTENARNVTARLRYDYWFTGDDTFFFNAAFRNDPFAALDARLQAQLGWQHNWINENETKHRFWSEIGFDVSSDFFALGQIPAASRPATNPFVQAAPRAYVGYDNHMNDAWQFLTGLEALPGLIQQNNGNGERFDIRLNYTAELRLALITSLAASIKFQLLYDSVPATRFNENMDTSTQLQLTYTAM